MDDKQDEGIPLIPGAREQIPLPDTHKGTEPGKTIEQMFAEAPEKFRAAQKKKV